jgi:hypothetical protein
MEMATPAPARAPVKAAEVNCEPWSVLKISGLPNFASASSTPRSAHCRRNALSARVEHRSTVRRAHLPDLLAKKIPLGRELPDLGV